MSLHPRHAHGPVQSREDVHEHLNNNKRDPQRVASVVYVTLAQTFEGPAVYSTLAGDYQPEVTAAPKPTAIVGTPIFYTEEPAAKSTPQSRFLADEPAVETPAVLPSSSEFVRHTTFATETASPSSHSRFHSTSVPTTSHASDASGAVKTSDALGTADAVNTAVADAPDTSESSAGSGRLSAGSQVGLAIGTLVMVGIVLGLCFMVWRKKRSAKPVESEKNGIYPQGGSRSLGASGTLSDVTTNGKAGAVAGGAATPKSRHSVINENVPPRPISIRSVSIAPRLSLRGLNQNRSTNGDQSNNSIHSGDRLNPAWKLGAANSGANPFADAPERSEKEYRAPSPGPDPFEEQRLTDVNLAGAGAGAAAELAYKQNNVSAAWLTGSEPASPRSFHSGNTADFSTTAGTPPPRQLNNVHRVQLDFKPSMDDEIELVSGALVRLLHEYDDGWALCITMDRSKQGVAPRTCLSKLPVKPRPKGPPQDPRRPSNSPGPKGPSGAMLPGPLTSQSPRTSPSPEQKLTADSLARLPATTAPASGQVPMRKPVASQIM